MCEDLEEAVKCCSKYQSSHATPAVAPLHPWEWPLKPWSRLHLDYTGPMEGKMYLVLVDAHSKWVEVMQVQSPTSTATVEKLRTVFATHGLPEKSLWTMDQYLLVLSLRVYSCVIFTLPSGF